VDWAALIDECDLAALIPGQYEKFAKPVSEALVHFLSGLPRAWQEQILDQQTALGAEATLAERLGQLARSCPVLHKLGQVLARDRRLAPELRNQLQPLECLAPRIAWPEIRAALERDLGPLAARGVKLLPPVLAEASVAFVVAFQRQGPCGPPGVFKVLKPGVTERLAGELEQLSSVGAYLDAVCHQANLPQLNYQELFDEVRAKLLNEVRLDDEQRHLTTARQLYADEPRVLIPRLIPEYCTPRVTAMERVYGVKATEHALGSAIAQRQFARTVARALVARPLFAHGPTAIFHCDPHAGNLMHATDGRLAILDWSLVAQLAEAERAALTQIMLAALMFDELRLSELVARLGVRGSVDGAILSDIVRRWLLRFRQGQFPSLDWLLGLLDDAALNAGLRVSGEMLLFRKSLLTLEGVLADLTDDSYALNDFIVSELVIQFASELPGRWLVAPRSREFGTRVSNADLARLAGRWPRAAVRFWRTRLAMPQPV
jgi:ubiquinone biosynthesis protein